MSTGPPLDPATSIAIVGMAGRFPGAETVEQFWGNLCGAAESVTRFSDAELLAAGVSPGELADPGYVKAAPVLDGIELFDAGFFGVSPREAQLIDPQQRLFVETAWAALESAGCDPTRFDGPIGVFAGAGLSTYLLRNLGANPAVLATASPMQVVLGNDKDSLATWTAYSLDLRGPCYTVQSYCSTSLVAVAAACTSLLGGECDLAVAGGAAVSVPQRVGYSYQAGGISSPDGSCRAFDADAQGAPLGSGVAAVVLKRLDDALARGDHVHAVIRGWAVNNDGALKAGFTAPGVRGQSGVIAEAIGNAGVDPATIDYIEAHGTGTALGDAAEFAALSRAFAGVPETGACVLGSVKTNVGHLDRAAGVTGLIKTALALAHRTMPPTLHFQRPNPRIGLAGSPFRVENTLIPWADRGHPRRAGVSAFGIGGTNAHVVLEQAPEQPRVAACARSRLLVLSGRTDAAADARVRDLADHLDRHPDADLADVAHTLQVGRRAFESRRCLVASDVAEARAALRAGRVSRSSAVQSGLRVGLLLADGPDAGVAAQLYDSEPAFRAAVDECRAVAVDPDYPDQARFAAQYASARLLAARGVPIDPLAGDRVGEIVTAVLAGVLPLPEAAGLLADDGAGIAHGLVTAPVRLDEALASVRDDGRIVVGAASVCDVPAAIGQLWLGGADIDWEAYAAGEPHRIVPLPTYPFQRERYWIDPPTAAASPDARVGRLASDEWFWVPRWEAAEEGSHEEPAGPFLVFSDGEGNSVADRLARRGVCVTVRPGGRFAVPDADTVILRPDEPGDYERLARLLAATGRLPATVVHLWGLTGAVPDATEATVMGRHRRRGFDSVVWLARALSEAGCTAVRILVGTDHMQPVDGSETLAPGKAGVLGACLSVPQEYPGFTCDSVDVAAADGTRLDDVVDVVDVVERELRYPATGAVVAYRGGSRRMRSFVPAPAPAPVPAPLLRDGGVYVLTGGLGSVGLLVAEHFARSVRAPRLVLTGRTGLPPRSEWDHAAGSPVAGRIRAVRTLEELGAQVLVVAADGSDPGSMRSVVEQARNRFGAVNGVVHAAGLPGADHFSLVSGLTPAGVDAHFTAKVDSLVALDAALAALAGEPLDFCVLQSSISAVLGGLGFAAYAAANCVLDAYAQLRARAGGRWVSVDWDTWLPTAAHTAGASMRQFSMTVDEGLVALERAVGVGAAQVVVSTGDLTARRRQWVGGDRDPAPASPPAQLFPRPELAEVFVPAASDEEARLAGLWQQVLGVDRVGVHDNFFELGGNSLMGLQLARRVGEELGVHLPAVAIFEAPTVAGLAARLAGTAEPLAGAPPTAAVGHDVAVVGLACRFPGADDPGEFWQNLRAGVESVRTFTAEELVAAGVPAELAGRPDYVRARPVLDGVDAFDAGFFGMDAGEAALTDPQHRVFLECCWQALEDAGHPPRAFPGQVGVFAGSNISTYLASMLAAGSLPPQVSVHQAVIANDKDALTTTASYKLGLTGPSMAVQSFCSTSLVAVHQAVRALRAGDCDLAIAGGVSIRVPGRVGHLAGDGRESADGHVRAFDARADGSLYGDGAGVVVLRRLPDALADGDTVRAVIKGTAVTNDGAARASFAATSVAGQREAARRALHDAGVAAETISYVEAHGTGTPLADAVEFAALSAAYGAGSGRRSCPIGTVKTNVGHLDQAAGVSGLIKTVLALEHAQIPATLHFADPNPQLDLVASPLHVNTRLVPWETADEGTVRRAAVHAFGSGGTNAHVVLEEAPARPPVASGRPWLVLPVSAQSPVALEQASADLAGYLTRHPELPLAEVAHTLQVGRESFVFRRVVVCASRGEAVAVLSQPGHDLAPAQAPPVVVDFAGLLDIIAADVAVLHDSEPLFRAVVTECCRLADPLLGTDLRAALLGAGTSRLPLAAGYVAGYALARLLAAWGVRAHAVSGDELGAHVAATLAGRLTIFEALRTLGAFAGRPPVPGDENPPGHMLVRLAEVARDGGRGLHSTVGALWLAGAGIDWAAYSAGRGHRRVPLPTYPFQRQRCWAKGVAA